ncbi:MAG: HAD family hydrolase [Planctomycetes bacterium]|nr:HAD family hydrolase [Planctomycetota bacterium]
MSANPLVDFEKQHDFLVAIDSDGCAFDTMEIKHKECFIPNFIKFMGLQPVSKYAREACEFANLYSKWRGANRFIAYTLALDLLEQRPEVKAREAKVPRLQSVRDWIEREDKLANPALEAEVERTADADLKRALDWSVAVNQAIDDIVHGVAPFPGVRESLQQLHPVADIIVCSATPTAALQKEWEEHDIARYVSDCKGRPAICGQEAGSKKETLGQAAAAGYAKDRVLMIGDAPGDQKAAEANGALFFPINPGHEEESWRQFIDEGCERFLSGRFAGEYQRSLLATFEKLLPETPPWVR